MLSCPLFAMISGPVHSCSASQRHLALRSPCAVQRFGNPAASHHSRKLSLKWREAWLCADGMVRLKLLNLIVGPGVESVVLDRALLDVNGRVRAQVAALERKLTKRAQRC